MIFLANIGQRVERRAGIARIRQPAREIACFDP